MSILTDDGLKQRPRVGIRVPPCAPVRQLAQYARRAERAGLNAVWLPDSQLMWRDVFAAAAVIGVSTDVIDVGTLVTNVETRHPSVVASGAATVQEATGGRFVLGLGRGGSAVSSVGKRPTPLAMFESTVNNLRHSMASADTDEEPETAALTYDAPPVPILIGVNGPKASDVAGRVGDGVVIFGGAHHDLIAAQLAIVRDGREAAHRLAEPFRVVSITWGLVTDDLERDARLTKPVCAFFAQTAGIGFLSRIGVTLEGPVSDLPDVLHYRDWNAAVKACDAVVSDQAALHFSRTYCLMGSMDEIRSRLGALGAVGVTDLCVRNFGNFGLPEDLIEPFGALSV